MKAKIIGSHICINDDDNDGTYETCDKWHYLLKDGDLVEVNMKITADSMMVRNTPEGMCYLCKFYGRYDYLPITWLDIDFSEKDIDWEQRRYEIAKEAISAILSNSRWALEYNKGYYKKDVVGNALSYADELIKELKSETS